VFVGVWLIAQGRGSDGYLVEEHPALIVVGVAILLVVVWWYLRARRS
jgi:hypothetical protein